MGEWCWRYSRAPISIASVGQKCGASIKPIVSSRKSATRWWAWRYEILDETTAKTTLLAVDRDTRRRASGPACNINVYSYLQQQGIRTVYTNCDDPAVLAWNCRHFGFRPTGKIIPKLEDFGLADKTTWTNLRLELDPSSRVMDLALPAGYDENSLVHDVSGTHLDAELKAVVSELVDKMRQGQPEFLARHFTAEDQASDAVDEKALAPLLSGDAWISDIVEDRQISNCIAYNFDNVKDAVIDKNLASLRRRLDDIVLSRMRALFPLSPNLTVENTGHFWYPRGGYMSWHTNLRTPGWRCYISFADEPGRSFFRFRDPRDERVITSWDQTWNLRLFHITPALPLWHAVYSETDRISLGYKIIFP